jgi:hypothetical protein
VARASKVLNSDRSMVCKEDYQSVHAKRH